MRGCANCPAEESDRRAAAGEPFVLRFRVPRDTEREVKFEDQVFGPQSKMTADIEDFALLRSNGMPTYHMASCADDLDLKISAHHSRSGSPDEYVQARADLRGAGRSRCRVFAHLPLLIAPDGAKLSKRKHGPVVSVTTYRDAGFLADAYVNFLCLLGWNPKDNREQMSREELIEAFKLEGVNRSNAVVNFTEEDPIDPKAMWLNSQHIHSMPVEKLSRCCCHTSEAAGFEADEAKMLKVTPLIRERIRVLPEVTSVADLFFVDELPPYDPAELIPQKGDAAMAVEVLDHASGSVVEKRNSLMTALETALREAATNLKVKTGQMFLPIRVAVCGRKTAPPLFETLEVLGRETSLKRIEQALGKLSRENRNYEYVATRNWRDANRIQRAVEFYSGTSSSRT